jgi:hypothetical protein
VTRLRRHRSGAAVGLVVAALLTGCGVPQDDEPRALDPAQAPFQVLREDQPTGPPTGDARADLYFVRDDRVVRQTRRVQGPADVSAVLELLLAGPTPGQVEDGISSALPSTFAVEGVELEAGVAVVTLDGSSTQISTSPLAFAQVVATLTAPGLARAVRFRLDDEDLPVPRGDASVTEAPVDRRDYAELLVPAADAPRSERPDGAAPDGAEADGSPAPG